MAPQSRLHVLSTTGPTGQISFHGSQLPAVSRSRQSTHHIFVTKQQQFHFSTHIKQQSIHCDAQATSDNMLAQASADYFATLQQQQLHCNAYFIKQQFFHRRSSYKMRPAANSTTDIMPARAFAAFIDCVCSCSNGKHSKGSACTTSKTASMQAKRRRSYYASSNHKRVFASTNRKYQDPSTSI